MNLYFFKIPKTSTVLFLKKCSHVQISSPVDFQWFFIIIFKNEMKVNICIFYKKPTVNVSVYVYAYRCFQSANSFYMINTPQIFLTNSTKCLNLTNYKHWEDLESFLSFRVISKHYHCANSYMTSIN